MVQIDVIGLGIEQPPLLGIAARASLEQAQVVYGSARQLASIQPHIPPSCAVCQLPKLAVLKTQLQKHERAVVLASGDPLYYGIGRFLLNHFPNQVTCHSGLSSVQGACQAVGVALQDAHAVSLHGRPLAVIRRYLRPHKTLVVITDKHSLPHHLAQECQTAGLAGATLHVIERMGYADAAHHTYTVQQLLNAPVNVDALHVTVIETGSDNVGGPCIYPSFPGIEDPLFITDSSAMAQVSAPTPKPTSTASPKSKHNAQGMLTKREVRIAVLSLLQGQAGDIGWDIGAGCGGVAVEWALWNPQGHVYALEHHPQRFACLQANRDKFGVVQNLHPLQQTAPEGFDTLPRPHKVFVGGSNGDLSAMLHKAWHALLPGGRMVATAVMEQSKACALQFRPQELTEQDILAATVMQIAVSRGEILAGQRVLRPNMAVMLYRWDKPYA